MMVSAVSRKERPRASEKLIEAISSSPRIDSRIFSRNMTPTANPKMASAMTAFPIPIFPMFKAVYVSQLGRQERIMRPVNHGIPQNAATISNGRRFSATRGLALLAGAAALRGFFKAPRCQSNFIGERCGLTHA